MKTSKDGNIMTQLSHLLVLFASHTLDIGIIYARSWSNPSKSPQNPTEISA